MTLEQRVALNAANKEKAAELQRKQARTCNQQCLWHTPGGG